MTRTLTLLVIDDDQSVCESLKRGLEQTRRYTVHTADSGAQALALVAEHLPDVILLDMLMPKMTGADVAARLRADQRTVGIPLIFLTGLMDKAEEQALGGCIDGERYLAKPASVEEIDAAVHEMLDGNPCRG